MKKVTRFGISREKPVQLSAGAAFAVHLGGLTVVPVAQFRIILNHRKQHFPPDHQEPRASITHLRKAIVHLNLFAVPEFNHARKRFGFKRRYLGFGESARLLPINSLDRIGSCPSRQHRNPSCRRFAAAQIQCLHQ